MTKPSSPRYGSAVRPGSRSLVGALHPRPQLRAGLVQLGYVAVGVALGVLTPRVTIGPTVSYEQLEAVFAGGLIALVSIVYALLFLIVQFGSTTHSPQAVIEISLGPTVEQERELLTGIEAGTAIQVIDRIEGLLRRLATRHLDVSVVSDTDGNPRVQLSMPDWDQFVRAGVDELINASRNLPSVQQRLVTLLDDLIRLSPPVRLPVLQRRRARLAGHDR